MEDQFEATGCLLTDRRITVERFRDELGDWRVYILSPFGSRIHAPWALAIEASLSQNAGFEFQVLYSCDGIVLRLADVDEVPGAEALLPNPEELEDRVVEQLAHSAFFAGQFRENAARALLLPRRRPGARTPLWTQGYGPMTFFRLSQVITSPGDTSAVADTPTSSEPAAAQVAICLRIASRLMDSYFLVSGVFVFESLVPTSRRLGVILRPGASAATY